MRPHSLAYDFPEASIVTATERDFLHLHTPEAVLEMIKDGSYDAKLTDFLNVAEPPPEDRAVVVREIYAKRLTPSDVGKSKGLVIKKKGVAEGYFPGMRDRRGKSMKLRFLDRRTREWTEFRYCYYGSSQTYALTTGWCKFVKANGLRENDIVKFYECAKDDGEYKERYIMVDVVRSGEEERALRVLVEAGEVVTKSFEMRMKTKKKRRRCKNGEEEEEKTAVKNASKEAVRLFGAVIG